MASNKIVLLETGSGCIRALLLQKKNKQISVLKARVLRVEQGRGLSEVFGSLFSDFPKENISLLFPREKCVFRNLEPQERTPAALKESADQELEEGLHFGKENTAFDYGFIKNRKTGLLCAASLKEIKNYSEPLEKVKVRPAALIPTTLALFEVFKKSAVYTVEPALLVCVSGARADIIACQEGAIFLSRGFEIKDRELNVEVTATLASLSKDGKSIKKIFFAGADIKDGVPLDLPGEFLKKAGLEGPGADWLLLYGLFLLTTEKEALSLDLFKNLAGKKGAVPVYTKLLRAAAVIFALIVAGAGIVYFLTGLAAVEREELRSELSGLEVQGGRKWAAAVSEIMNAVPEEIVLNEMSGDNKGEVNLKGTAKARKDITVFIDSLNHVRGLSSELAFANELATGGGQVTQFMLKIRVKAVAK